MAYWHGEDALYDGDDSSVQIRTINIDVGHQNAAYVSDGGISNSPDSNNVNAKNDEQPPSRSHNGVVVDLSNDSDWVKWVTKQFTKYASSGRLTREKFTEAFSQLSTKSFFADRFFTLFSQDKSGTIELNELINGFRTVRAGTAEERFRFVFDVFDVNGNGKIDREELCMVIRSCLEESSLEVPGNELQTITDALFDEADGDHCCELPFEELLLRLRKYPGVLENLTCTLGDSSWVKPPPDKKNKKNHTLHPLTQVYIRNNLSKVIFIIIYYIINLALIGLSIYRYWTANVAVIVARCCGMCLNFNCAFILVLMLRRSLTWLRSTPLGNYLPLDHNIYFHQMVGFIIFVLGMIHTVAHCINIAITMDELNELNVTALELTNDTVPAQYGLKYWEWLFTMRSQLGWIGPGFAYVSGVVLDVILIVMVVCAMPCVRRNGYFEVFFWTHLLYIPFLVFTVLHGPIFWYFLIAPGIIFAVEIIVLKSKLYKLSKFGHVYITEVNLLPSKVTHLLIARPDNFRYKPGDYININIPAIASQEWHPFTISSAPERKDSVWLHVRSVGGWTHRLYDFFAAYEDIGPTLRMDGSSDVQRARTHTVTGLSFCWKRSQSMPYGRHKFVNVEVYIDGPYGTPTREIFETEHAVLIASGIGVTPYASILQSIAYRYSAMRSTCPRCEHTFIRSDVPIFMKLNKVDFIWINRDQKCFEWLINLLAILERDGRQDENFQQFLEMQMYMTRAMDRCDIKMVGLQLALDALYQREKKDFITGLKTRTQPGRPDWRKVFNKIRKERKGKVKIFLCGSPSLAKCVKKYCEEYGFGFSKEHF